MIEIKQHGKHLGAEILGVDLSRPVDDATFEQIVAAFHQHSVAFFRNQDITPAQQVAFSRRFGELEPHVRKEARLEGHPEIFVLSNILDENGKAIGSQDAGRMWHSDLSYKREPSRMSLLYAREVPEKDGVVLGDTLFASTAAAYDALPAEMQRRLSALKNVHSYSDYRAKNRAQQQAEEASGGRVVQEAALDEQQKKSVPDVATPVVRTHPFNGRKCLFVNEGHTSYIVGMPRAESDALLAELYRHITQPEFVYRHRWQQGDLLMWDNCSTQHKATFDYDLPLRRLMHRTTIHGSVPF